MDVLTAVFVAPFLDMADSPAFFFEVVIGGLMTGVMYSLVALGFVLKFVIVPCYSTTIHPLMRLHLY